MSIGDSLLLRAGAAALALAVGATCLGNIELVGGTSTATGGGGAGGGIGGQDPEHCSAPPSGRCEDVEDCVCDACKVAAGCSDDGRGCLANGVCDTDFEDTCVCSDCDHSMRCVNCNHDGTCQLAHEGCGCVDCSAEETCADNTYSCDGGAPDGLCDVDESCECNDCILDPSCMCDTDAYCDSYEPCTCPDCDFSTFCAFKCNADGWCNGAEEGCGCSDCMAGETCSDNNLACEGGVPDGNCLGGELCDCPDCIAKDHCLCDGLDCDYQTPCICGECDTLYYCMFCDEDGTCDPALEGCSCPDCASRPACLDNLSACVGGVADGTCGSAETCTCVDCMLTAPCMCLDDAYCDFDEPCFCPDCAPESYCDGCELNGECSVLFEGCGCDDCSSQPYCT